MRGKQFTGSSGFSIEMSRVCRRLIVSAEEIVPTEELRILHEVDRQGLNI